MQAYAYETTVDKGGMLTIKNLPFTDGETVEVIIILRPKLKHTKKRYPFWGKPIKYLNPTDPVAETDWEVIK